MATLDDIHNDLIRIEKLLKFFVSPELIKDETIKNVEIEDKMFSMK